MHRRPRFDGPETHTTTRRGRLAGLGLAALMTAVLAPAAPAIAGTAPAVKPVARANPGGYAQSPAFGTTGNMYFSERRAQVVRMVTPGNDEVVNGRRGEVTVTVAGNGAFDFSGDGGPATSASLAGPAGVVVDSAGNLYIADQSNHRVRKVTPGADGVVNGGADEIITTVAGSGSCGAPCTPEQLGDGGPATSAKLSSPTGLAIDAADNLYIADIGNHRVRMVDTAGIITTVAGTGTSGYSGDGGPATAAQLNGPIGVTVAGSALYVTGQAGSRVRLVNLGSTPVTANGVTVAPGNIATVAGTATSGYSGDGGPATLAQLNSPFNTAVDPAGNLYISDERNDAVRKVDSAGIITTLVGPPTLLGPRGVAVYGGRGIGARALYIANTGQDRVLRTRL